MQRISELVAACGLELQVRLVPADDHDWSLVASNGHRAPAERVENALGVIHFAQDLRRARC